MARSPSPLIVSVVLVAAAALGPAFAAVEAAPPASQWRTVKGGPGPRYALQAVWDAPRERLLVHAGETNRYADGKFAGFVMHADTWSFDPATDTWTRLNIQGANPSARAFYAACFDGSRNGIWLHGGFDGEKMLDDLWFFDCAKDAWSKVDQQGELPPIRDFHSMIYNAKRDQLMIFAGLKDLARMDMLDDHWTFDTKRKTWTKLPAAKVGPAARFGQTTAWDEKGQRMFVQGGLGAQGKPTSAELWVYAVDDGAWVSRKDKRAMNFTAGQMVYLADRDQLLIFGGGGSNWEYWGDLKAAVWTPAATAAPVDRRGYHAMALDPTGGRLFVIGGVPRNFLDECVPGDLAIATLPAATETAPETSPAVNAP